MAPTRFSFIIISTNQKPVFCQKLIKCGPIKMCVSKGKLFQPNPKPKMRDLIQLSKSLLFRNGIAFLLISDLAKSKLTLIHFRINLSPNKGDLLIYY